MTNQNQLLPFAVGGGAAVLTNGAYNSGTFRQIGFSTGIADPAQANTVWRQAAFAAAMLGQFTADYGQHDVLDDGNVAAFENNFLTALRLVTGRVWAVDTGSVNAVVITNAPALTSLAPGATFFVRIKNDNTSNATLNVDGLGAIPIITPQGPPVIAGDLKALGVAEFVYDGANFQLVSRSGTAFSQQAYFHFGQTDSGTTNALAFNLSPSISAYIPGTVALVVSGSGNTGATTINCNGLGVKAITRQSGAALTAGDIPSGALALIAYDGTEWVLLNVVQSVVGGPGTTPDHWNDISGPLNPYWVTVKSATTTTPPGSPTAGDTYIVPSAATGVWNSHIGAIAQYTGATFGWVYVTYANGSLAGVTDIQTVYYRQAGVWRNWFATNAEVDTGTATDIPINPAGLKHALATIDITINDSIHSEMFFLGMMGG